MSIYLVKGNFGETYPFKYFGISDKGPLIFIPLLVHRMKVSIAINTMTNEVLYYSVFS